MRPVSDPPICCAQEAHWTYQGPNLYYYYCKACKKEVIVFQVHFLGTKNKCTDKDLWQKGAFTEHYWPDTTTYKRKEACLCGKVKP